MITATKKASANVANAVDMLNAAEREIANCAREHREAQANHALLLSKVSELVLTLHELKGNNPCWCTDDVRTHGTCLKLLEILGRRSKTSTASQQLSLW